MSPENHEKLVSEGESSHNPEHDLGTRLVDRVRQALNERWQEIDSEHRVDAFTALYLRPRDKCVPNWFIGDGIMDAIIDLYYEPLAAVREELTERKRIWPGEISICAMPSWESESIALMYTRQRVLFGFERKAWLFWWESEKEMQDELAQWYEAAERGLTQESTLAEHHRQALKEVLGQVAVLLPGEERVRVIDQARLKTAVEDLQGLI
jgi:hypothetical protein